MLYTIVALYYIYTPTHLNHFTQKLKLKMLISCFLLTCIGCYSYRPLTCLSKQMVKYIIEHRQIGIFIGVCTRRTTIHRTPQPNH